MISPQNQSMRGMQELLQAVHGGPKTTPMIPFKDPIPSQPAASKKLIPTGPVVSKRVSEDPHQQIVRKLVGRVVETVEELESAGINQIDVINLAFIYRDLAPGDEVCPISIIMLKNFLENVIKPSNEVGYNKIIAYYNVLAEERSSRKTEKQRNAAQSVLSSYRTVENAYLYSYGFKDAADNMAKKLKAPEDMSVIERVKWLRIWAVILCDQLLFWGDLDDAGRIKGKKNTAEFNELHIYPESMILIWYDYLRHLPDESILCDMIQSMVELFPEKAQNALMRYGEMTVNVPDSTKVEHIRNSVKKLFFPKPWLSQSSCFCTTLGVQNFPIERLVDAVTAFKNGGIENMSTFELPYVDVYNNCKQRTVTCYKYGTVKSEHKEFNAGVTCKEELEMYIVLYKWLLAHPDFKFGAEQKTLKEYGMDDLLEEKPDLRTCAATWITNMGFARDEEDINWEVAEAVLKLSENGEMFEEFCQGNVSGDEIFNAYHFVSIAQAIACFSKISKLSAQEINKMGAALKRVKMFGTDRALPGDLIYLELFCYMVKNNPEALGKSLIQLYASKLCPQ